MKMHNMYDVCDLIDKQPIDRLHSTFEVLSYEGQSDPESKLTSRHMIYRSEDSEKVIGTIKGNNKKKIRIPTSYLFSSDLPMEFASKILGGNIVLIPPHSIIDMSISILMGLDIDPIKKNSVNENIAKAQLQTIIGLSSKLQGDRNDIILSENYGPKVSEIMRYLISNMQNEISIERMANQLNINPLYASRIFRKECSQSIVGFLTKYRLIISSYILEYTDLAINEIVYSCGFGSVSNFYKVFKRQYAVSPKEYRSKMQMAHKSK